MASALVCQCWMRVRRCKPFGSIHDDWTGHAGHPHGAFYSELLTAVEGPFAPYSPDEMRAIGERAIRGRQCR
ncbi:hypothetical protein SBV1_960006 [Verrucomicrobia bacterium]|nr:hypothetical protein SBV1_960006 [Verrucomicrobiota bacterium]